MAGKDKSCFEDPRLAFQYEWLETNGLGGWASSSITGCNTRRYHGLLIAATKPPTERMALISKLDETICIGESRIDLGTNAYPNNTIHPSGYTNISKFTKGIFPEWLYEFGDIKIKKIIAMVDGENTTVVTYDVLSAPSSFDLELMPLLSVRDYHALMHSNNTIQKDFEFTNGSFNTKPYVNAPKIFIKVPGSIFTSSPDWYHHFNYPVEQYRGLDFEEDLFTHGKFSIQLNEGDSLGIILSTEDTAGKDAHRLLEAEYQRRINLIEAFSTSATMQQLALAADQFIVKRDEDLKTIIAGYHWFTDWGRDTMIALRGLCLSTNRIDDAKKILAAFAKNVSMGMLPNRFQDNNEPPEYNNVDGTLWYFISIYEYLRASHDEDFVLQELLPVLKDIVDWHFRGTRYNIHVDDDGLLYAGEEGQQLTWMDARIGSWVVTPRMGKPVEIQALWYNAQKIFALLLRKNGQQHDAELVDLSAGKTKASFIEKFWNSEGSYLYDRINENNMPVADLRPNQLFAISLPFALIDGNKAESVLEIVEKELYTPVGLRTLPKSDPRYAAVYGGDTWKRDSSYHQGTVWSWLLGAYIDAIMKTGYPNKKEKTNVVIENFRYHLNEGCLGTVSEIFDADAPHHPRGCVAQAWGVGEILRVISEYDLFDAAEIESTKTPALELEA